MLLAGSLLTGTGFVDGWADLAEGVVRAAGRGPPPRPPEGRGVLLPAPVNAHTHLGDRALRGRMDPALGLDALVAPPHGLKHRLLAETPEPILAEGMREGLAELAVSGVRLAVDFREGGAAGVSALRRAAAGGIRVLILGRATADSDLDSVLDVADGVGIPAVGNLPEGEAGRWAAAARRRGKVVALHASEGIREPIDPVLDLRPHHVVHMTQGSRDDFAALAAAGVQVVVCPRSNAALVRRLPDVAGMLAAGCRVALGTDNASMQTLDLWAEAAFLAREGKLDRLAALRVAFLGWSDPGGPEPEGVVEGARGPFLLLAPQGSAEATALSGAPTVLKRLG